MTTSWFRSGSVRPSDGAHGGAHGRVPSQSHVRQDAARVGELQLLQRDHHHRRHDADPERLRGAAQSKESGRKSAISPFLFKFFLIYFF